MDPRRHRALSTAGLSGWAGDTRSSEEWQLLQQMLVCICRVYLERGTGFHGLAARVESSAGLSDFPARECTGSAGSRRQDLPSPAPSGRSYPESLRDVRALQSVECSPSHGVLGIHVPHRRSDAARPGAAVRRLTVTARIWGESRRRYGHVFMDSGSQASPRTCAARRTDPLRSTHAMIPTAPA